MTPAILALCAFASGFSARLLEPLVLPVATTFAVAPAAAAALTTAYALPYAGFQPVLGTLADRWGKARCMQVCVAGLALALLLGALSTSFGRLLATRVAAGVCAGGLIPLVLATLGDRYALAERQVRIGRMLLAIIGGQTLGAVAAGLVNGAVGWRGVLVLSALVAGSAAVAAWRSPAEPPAARAAGAPQGFVAVYASIFRNPLARWVYGCVMLEALAFFGVFPYVGPLLARHAEAGADTLARQAGLVIGAFGAGGVLYALIVRRLLQWLGALRMSVAGCVIAALAYAALPWATAWWMDAIAMFIAGLAFYMVHNSLQTQATELAPHARASAVSLFAAGLFAAQGLAPLVFGAMMHAGSTTTALMASAAALLMLAFIVRCRVLGR